MIQDHHVMKKVLFTHNDRFLMHLQHRNTICTSTSEEEEELYKLKHTKNKEVKMLKASHIFE